MCTDQGLCDEGQSGRTGFIFCYGGNMDFQVQSPEKILFISVIQDNDSVFKIILASPLTPISLLSKHRLNLFSVFSSEH